MTIRLRSPRYDLAWTRQGNPDESVTPRRVTQPCDNCHWWHSWCRLRQACWADTRRDLQQHKPRPGPNKSVWDEQATIDAIQAWVRKTGELPTTYMWMRATKTHPGNARVARLFGTWNNGIRAAGYTPKRSRYQP